MKRAERERSSTRRLLPAGARGRVYLVGAGPGDPGLITVRGAELLARADVIVRDRLVNPALFRLTKPGAIVLDAGARSFALSRSGHFLARPEGYPALGRRGGGRQRAIDRALAAHARAGRMVVRLKGGDPFLFGRGGEEGVALARARVPFEVVPGVSSALAAPAYAGIPLTHRGLSSSVAVVAGRAGRGPGAEEPDWELLAHAAGTLVILMGARAFPRIAARLLRAGMSPATPVAAVRWGTWPRQETLAAPLGEAARRLARLAPPAVIVVGPTAGLAPRLGRWFAARPLRGLRVAVLRSREQGGTLAGKLEAAGAETLQCPVIRTVPLARPPGWRRVLAELPAYRWVMFTSAAGVACFFALLRRAGRDARALGAARVGAVGPGTAEVLARHGVRPDLVPRRHVAEGLAEAWRGPKGTRILLPLAARARDTLARGLARRGAWVTVLPLYRTVRDPRGLAALRRACRAGAVDVLAVSSSSMAEFALHGPGAVPRRWLRGVQAASIGPITSRALRRHGLPPAAEARPSTLDALVRALVRFAHAAKGGTSKSSVLIGARRPRRYHRRTPR